MIKVPRGPCPSILQKNGPQWLTGLETAKNHWDSIMHDPMATDKDKKRAEKQFKTVQSKYNHVLIKTALETMFNGGIKSKSTKCAYCETHIESKKGQDIEHFYPKSIYWRRTFEWENLLIACQTCNEEFKVDNFPVNADGHPLLIDPTTCDPVDHLDFIFDADTFDSHVEGKDEMGRVTVDFFALNDLRSSDSKRRNLVKQRQASVTGWIALALLIQQEADPVKSQALKDKLQLLCHSQTQYAAFARAIYAMLA